MGRRDDFPGARGGQAGKGMGADQDKRSGDSAMGAVWGLELPFLVLVLIAGSSAPRSCVDVSSLLLLPLNAALSYTSEYGF